MLAANRRHWDELVGIHLAPGGYDLHRLRAGDGWLGPIVEAELATAAPDLADRRVIHLQCHFGADTLVLAQRGAAVVGVDFSPVAIGAARALAAELGLADRASFVECDLYDAPRAVAEAGFDLAFVTWGAIGWLPDIRGWARVVAGFLRPGGRLLLVEGHPAAYVFDDAAASADGMPGFFVPYFDPAPLAADEADYANRQAALDHPRTYTWLHPLGGVASALVDAGLGLARLQEHDAVPWQMFDRLVPGGDGLWRWPDRPWLPLSYTLVAERRL